MGETPGRRWKGGKVCGARALPTRQKMCRCEFEADLFRLEARAPSTRKVVQQCAGSWFRDLRLLSWTAIHSIVLHDIMSHSQTVYCAMSNSDFHPVCAPTLKAVTSFRKEWMINGSAPNASRVVLLKSYYNYPAPKHIFIVTRICAAIQLDASIWVVSEVIEHLSQQHYQNKVQQAPSSIQSIAYSESERGCGGRILSRLGPKSSHSRFSTTCPFLFESTKMTILGPGKPSPLSRVYSLSYVHGIFFCVHPGHRALTIGRWEWGNRRPHRFFLSPQLSQAGGGGQLCLSEREV
jgi:hypothetical protein